MYASRKRLWQEALRSGEYVQGTSYLKKDHGRVQHCCLGVACEVAKTHGVPVVETEKTPVTTILFSFDGRSDVLPASVQSWFGLEDQDPKINGYHLTQLNDHQRASFERIADLLDEIPETPEPT